MKQFFLALLGAGALAACAQNTPQENTQQPTQKTQQPTQDSTQTTKDNTSMESKTLVVFFSRTGENYGVGYIEKGNTHIVAEMIAEETGATLFQIEPVQAYPTDYSACTEQAQTERNENARPAIRQDIDIEAYDTIYIGYPIWWGDMPMPVYTFLEKHDWSGKVLYPFCTHEGSGLGSTRSYLQQTCTGAKVGTGFAVQGTVARTTPEPTRRNVHNWLAQH